MVEGLASVMLAALEQAAEQRMDAAEVACEISYRGTLGIKKTLRANMFTTALLAQQPEVMRSLVATARANGVPVLPPAAPRRAPRRPSGYGPCGRAPTPWRPNCAPSRARTTPGPHPSSRSRAVRDGFRPRGRSPGRRETAPPTCPGSPGTRPGEP
ncbi:hypothetical protein ACFQ2B_32500 [Streptomyces stramineus]